MSPPQVIGRYTLHGEIASGGMATVHYGRLRGATGFARTVAIKRLHPQNAKNPEFVTALLDEAKMAARIRHPNVVSVHDLVAVDDELLLVMDYVGGETLARLLATARARQEPVPISIAVAILSGVLRGLDAAHEVRNVRGERMNLVHRDVSPQNVLVGQDGVTRIMDFGIAKAVGRSQATTDDGSVKGKAAYMSPEQISGTTDPRTDLWAASVVAWEICAGARLFDEESDIAAFQSVLTKPIPSLDTLREGLPPTLVGAIERGLARSPLDRWQTAREYADAVFASAPVASPASVTAWVEALAGPALEAREREVRAIESGGVASSVSEARSPLDTATPRRPARTPRTAGVIAGVAVALALALAFAVFARRREGAVASPLNASLSASASTNAIASAHPAQSTNSADPELPKAAAATTTASSATAATRPPAKKTRASSAAPAPPPGSAKLCPIVDAEGIVTFRPCS